MKKEYLVLLLRGRKCKVAGVGNAKLRDKKCKVEG